MVAEGMRGGESLFSAGRHLFRPDDQTIALEASGEPERRRVEGVTLGSPFSPQNPAGQQLHSENSVTGQGPFVPHQTLPRWGHTLPHKLSRQRTEDRNQALLPLGPPQ